MSFSFVIKRNASQFFQGLPGGRGRMDRGGNGAGREGAAGKKNCVRPAGRRFRTLRSCPGVRLGGAVAAQRRWEGRTFCCGRFVAAGPGPTARGLGARLLPGRWVACLGEAASGRWPLRGGRVFRSGGSVRGALRIAGCHISYKNVDFYKALCAARGIFSGSLLYLCILYNKIFITKW